MPPARAVLYDTSYFVAMLDPRDGLHRRALELSQVLLVERVVTVTTDAVVIEVGNFFSATPLRTAAASWLATMRQGSSWDILHLDAALLLAAEARYRRYDDKNWSMTDCISMEVMERRRIREVATSDSGFAQAGFTVLMA